MIKIVITGGNGLLGSHARIRLHALNCAAIFAGRPQPYLVTSLNRYDFQNIRCLNDAVKNADIVLHFAGINRGSNDEIEKGNPQIANMLIAACRQVDAEPHIVYANSTHYLTNSVYGKSKRIAHEILSRFTNKYTNLILPHIYGEGAKPNYNNVTATFIECVINGELPEVNSTGRVELSHAGIVANRSIDAAINGIKGEINLIGKPMTVQELLSIIKDFHNNYMINVYPHLVDAFSVSLFNTYRNRLYPEQFPRNLKIYTDMRGKLFEAVKGGSAGQTFLSWTEPNVTRGDHFHLNKIERFLVLEGDAIIRMRHVLKNDVWEYKVSGDQPAIIDMPTLYTHSIENIGKKPLLTLFWSNEVFDPNNPDTYADTVLKG